MKILVVSAHADDEILGVGGSLLNHKNNYDELNWLIITKPHKDMGYSSRYILDRKKQINHVKKAIGFKNTFELNYITSTLSRNNLKDLIPDISEIFNKVKPERVYVVNRSDSHSDHRMVFDSVLACTKSFRADYLKEVWMYECLSETETAPAIHENIFIPNAYIDISEYLDGKIKLMNIYTSEVAPHPFPRSEENIRSLAILRGSTAGVKFAEAFQIIKRIEK